MIPVTKVRNPGSKKYLFTYGTLLPPDILEFLLNGKPLLTPNRLKGYASTKIYVGDRGFPTLVETKSTNFADGFTTKVSIPNLSSIDEHFSYTNRHSRVLVKLANDMEAWTYIVSNVSPEETVQILKETAVEAEVGPPLRVSQQLSGLITGLEITSES
jgi:gamma-glutamylcyclotransferase (GGCT)/AIG2-like uncharacterized protein YtfP